MSVKVVIVVGMHLSLQNKSHCSVIFNNAQHVKKAFGYIFYSKQHNQTMNQMGALRRSSQKLNNYEEIQEKVACFHATHHGALSGWRCDA